MASDLGLGEKGGGGKRKRDRCLVAREWMQEVRGRKRKKKKGGRGMLTRLWMLLLHILTASTMLPLEWRGEKEGEEKIPGRFAFDFPHSLASVLPVDRVARKNARQRPKKETFRIHIKMIKKILTKRSLNARSIIVRAVRKQRQRQKRLFSFHRPFLSSPLSLLSSPLLLSVLPVSGFRINLAAAASVRPRFSFSPSLP